MTEYLYDSKGAFVAFRIEYDGRYLFDPDGEWIGWFPWPNDDVATRDGSYLGTVIEDRLLWRIEQRHHVDPGYPGAPRFPGRASYPGNAGYFGSVEGFTDVPHHLLAPRHAYGTSLAS
jgi:hypothetical protein